MESGLERVVKVQVRTAIRLLIKQLRCVSLIAAPTMKVKDAREIAHLLRDTQLIADRADELWDDTLHSGKIRRRGPRGKKE